MNKNLRFLFYLMLYKFIKMKIVRSLHIKSMTRLLDPQSYGATYLSISSNNYENSDLSYKIFNKEEMYKYKNGNFRKTMIYDI